METTAEQVHTEVLCPYGQYLSDLSKLNSLDQVLDNLLQHQQKKGNREPKLLFDKVIECDADFPGKLKPRLNVFVERIQTAFEARDADGSTTFKKKLLELTDEPCGTIQKETGVNLANLANAQYKHLYYCLYVVTLHKFMPQTDSLLRRYELSFDQFKAEHLNAIFAVRRVREENGTGKKQKVIAYYKMSEEFLDPDWQLLYQYRNLFVLCYIISPSRADQKNLFISIASILTTGVRAAQGGKSSMFITAVGDVVFTSVLCRMFPYWTKEARSHKMSPDRLVKAYENQKEYEREHGRPRGVVSKALCAEAAALQGSSCSNNKRRRIAMSTPHNSVNDYGDDIMYQFYKFWCSLDEGGSFTDGDVPLEYGSPPEHRTRVLAETRPSAAAGGRLLSLQQLHAKLRRYINNCDLQWSFITICTLILLFGWLYSKNSTTDQQCI